MTTFDLNFAPTTSRCSACRVQALDLESLESSYRAVQSKVHPDKHAHAADSDRRLAMQWATRINEAFQTLKSPGPRARYLLGLLGHDPQIESNTAMPTEFLMNQMELREAVEEARAAADEDGAGRGPAAPAGRDQGRVPAAGGADDGSKDYAAAAMLVRQLMFQEKLLTAATRARSWCVTFALMFIGR
jgi:molecular chaperone HscB